MYQGWIILSQLLGRPYHPAEYQAVPRVTFTDPEIGVTDRLPEPVEIAAYYAVAEALTNTAKHAQASTAEVEVCRSCCPSIETDAPRPRGHWSG